jgi:molybdate transport system ATP-binding protein
MIDIAITKKLQGADGTMTLDIDMQIEERSFVAIAGQSGSGKTTLLRILAGLEEAEGKIVVDGEVWLDRDKKIKLPPQKRKIGFVFQSYALFENMTVLQNLLYAANDPKLAERLLSITHLEKLKNRLPNSLSGGQRQRVSLCRALMNRPRLLLMDEPLSALDPQMRTSLQQEIRTLHESFQTTTLMVSHDPSEIYRLADSVIMLERGAIMREGSPAEILLKTSGSAKFSFEGELLDIVKVDVIYIAIVAIGQQLVEVVVSSSEAKRLKIGERVEVSTKAFGPTIRTR